MPSLTVYLTPPLTGAKGTLYLVYEGQYFSGLPLPPSVDGLISVGVGTASPSSSYAVVFEEQTIGGVTYRKAESTTFNLLSDVTRYMTLTPTGEEPPPPGETAFPWTLIPQLVAGAALLLL